jgi:anaerobic selenocysteine-containing dehydrogenase
MPDAGPTLPLRAPRRGAGKSYDRLMEQRVTFCRICAPLCGMVVDVEDNRVVRINGDVEHPLTRGFTCPKGRRFGALHHDPDRIVESQVRRADGTFAPIDAAVATEEIAAKLNALVAEHGPESVGLFIGTQSYNASLTYSFAGAWHRATQSPKRYTTNTLDATAKMISAGRLGSWGGGNQRWDESDVWMMVGGNPPVSMQGGGITGYPIHDPIRRVEESRARGMKIIVVDPRRTEAATHADIHLQLRPGTDATLVAGLLKVIFDDGLEDAEFLAQWTDGVDELRAAVAWATPAEVGRVCGLEPELVVEAARVFGTAGKGQARSGTGLTMGPHSNAAQHLVDVMNVVCGRFPRAGDRVTNGGVLSGPTRAKAQPSSPMRYWEHSFKLRTGVLGLGVELPSPAMLDDILEPGDGRLRALVISGGNPVACFPDQDRIIEALQGLELLVTVDPLWSETAQLAHYVIAPTMGFERWDDTRGFEGHFVEAFAQARGPILEPPPGVIEDWEFFYDLAHHMGLTLQLGKRVFEPGTPRPTTVEMLESMADKASVPHEEVRKHPHGKIFEGIEPGRVAPADEDANGRFAVLPPDVADELRRAFDDAAASADADGPRERPFMLINRRNRDSMNSVGRRQAGARYSYNPCFVHPDDLADLGVDAGTLVMLTSKHGSMHAVVQPDATMRRGAASMTHCYGGLPDLEADPLRYGSNPSRLLSIDSDLQEISMMPHMSAVPISIEPA